MSKKTFGLLVLLTLAGLVACATPTLAPTPAPTLAALTSVPTVAAPTVAPTAAPTGPITVTILHTNDMHGAFEGEKLKGGDGTTFEFGGVANAMGTIARLKKEVGGNALTVDVGDFFVGSFASNRDQGKTMVAAMNVIGYDALALGNHDFDQGQDVLKARAAEAKFPFLAANLMEEATGKAPAWVKPYIVRQIAGVRFGVIGTTYPSSVIIKASGIKGLKFLSDVDAVKQVLPEVKPQADLIVVVAHQGTDYIQSLAEVPGVDVIVSGHNHVSLQQPKVIGSTIVVQAGAKAQYVGRLDLKIDPTTKKILDYTKNNENVSAVSTKAQTPPQVSDMIGQVVADARAAMNRPIGETLTDLMRQYTFDGRTTGEYPLANLIVDAMLAANQAGDRPADLAIHNQGGIRADLPKGPITYGKLYEVVPMDNVLTALDMTGADIKAVLEVAVSCPRVQTTVAGMSFTYDCSKPSGSRVSNLKVRGEPMDLQKVYRVETIDYLAGGGDGQTAFTKGKNPVYGDPVVDVVAAYVTKHSPLNLKVEGRIVEAK